MPPEIVMDVPLGTPSDNTVRIYVRDQAGALRHPDAPSFEEHAALPEAARDTGYSQGTHRPWVIPDDDRSIYVVDGQEAERWPRGQNPPCD